MKILVMLKGSQVESRMMLRQQSPAHYQTDLEGCKVMQS